MQSASTELPLQRAIPHILGTAVYVLQCARICVLFFFRFQKNMTFYVFFEMMYHKVAKRHKKYQFY